MRPPAKCLVKPVIAVMIAASFSCLPGSHRGNKDVANPFPREMLNHRLFPVFWSEDLLGCSFRDEERGLVGPLYWTGKVSSSSAGEDRTVRFTEEQVKWLSVLLPGVSFRAGHSGKVSYTVILKGLRINQLTRPVLLPEYRDSGTVRGERFIASTLGADEVIIRADIATDRGIRPAEGAVLPVVFEGTYAYSAEHKGIVAARNCLIGYALVIPTGDDLARKAEDEMERRSLSVFDLRYEGGDEKYSYLCDIIRSKLEEALQWVPGIDVMTDRKDEAKYHVTGNVRPEGARIRIDMELVNTYNRKRLSRATRTVDAGGVNELYALHSDLIREYAGVLGVPLDERTKKYLNGMIHQTDNADLIRKYHDAKLLKKKGKYREAEALLNVIIAADPGYTDAQLLKAETCLSHDKLNEAESIFNKVLVNGFKYNNPQWKSRAYYGLSIIKGSKNYILEEWDYLNKSLLIAREIKDDDSELVRGLYKNLINNLNERSENADNPDQLRKQALEYGMKNLALTSKKFGPHSLAAAEVYEQLSVAYSGDGKTDKKSLDYALKAVRIIEKEKAVDTREAPWAYGVLGYALRVNGQYNKALKYLYKSLDIQKKLNAQGKSSLIAELLRQISFTHVLARDFENAVPPFIESLSLNRAAIGDAYDFPTDVYNTFGDAIMYRGGIHRVYRSVREKGEKKWESLYTKLLQSATRGFYKDYVHGASKNTLNPRNLFNGAEAGTPPQYFALHYDDNNRVSVGSFALDPVSVLFCLSGRVVKNPNDIGMMHCFRWKRAQWQATDGKNIPGNMLVAALPRFDDPVYICRVRNNGKNYFGRVNVERGVCICAAEKGCEESDRFDVLVETELKK